MEFGEKLQKLRTGEGLTQQELAEKLYVSRAAVSKWESGRGYPSIDSLRAVAKHFHVTVDELIGGEEMAALAEEDIREAKTKYTALLCGLLDCLAALLFILPVFGESGTDGVSSVALPLMTGIGGWLKAVFLVTVGLTAANGLCTAVVVHLDRPRRNRYCLIAGMALSVAGTMIFILARQPYAGAFFLCLLAAKGILALKSK